MNDFKITTIIQELFANHGIIAIQQDDMIDFPN